MITGAALLIALSPLLVSPVPDVPTPEHLAEILGAAWLVVDQTGQ